MIQGKSILADAIKNVRTELLHARLACCAEDWCNLDYTPVYSKFYYILEGEGWLRIGDREYYPRPGEFYLMPAGTRQGYATISDRPFVKYFCHFHALVGDVNLFDLVQLPPFVTVENPERVRGLFDQLLQNLHDERLAAGFQVKAALCGLLAAYIDAVPEREICLINNEATEILGTVLDYISEHLAEPLTVSLLADLVHFHPVYFSRFFKKHILITPKCYISQKRLEKAKELLVNSGLSMAEIAARTGYQDLFYFSSTFKAHFGQSPSEYRGSV